MTNEEARQLSDYFALGNSGYILGFNNDSWDVFTNSVIGLKLQEMYGGSKGKSLKSFLMDPSQGQELKYRLIDSLEREMQDYISSLDIGDQLRIEDTRTPVVKRIIRDTSEYINGKTVSTSPAIKQIDLEYIKSLPKRIEADIKKSNFDSALTKSNTLIDEVSKAVLEKTGNPILSKKHVDSRSLRKAVADDLNMNVDPNMDVRVKKLLSSLNSLSDSVIELRNLRSDSHAQGSKRTNISEAEAVLVANSAITYSEYIYSVFVRKVDEN